MASLRSDIVDGKKIIALPNGPWREGAGCTINENRRLLIHEAKLVNAQSVYDDLAPGGCMSTSEARSKVPCPKAPFPIMWLESIQEGDVSTGVLVEQAEPASASVMLLDLKEVPDLPLMLERDQPFTIVKATCWRRQEGSVFIAGQFFYWLDAAGELYWYDDAPDFHSGHITPEGIDEGDEETNHHWLFAQRLWVTHSFARMNCHNVKLVPVKGGGPKIRKGHPHPPFSIWHEIKVTSVPELRRQSRETAPEGDKREIRFHDVRGHYADYTKGKGLFGKLKVRIWIPAHTAGQEALGAVAGSYRIQ